MGLTIYENNDVEITSKDANKDECKIDVNGKNLIWISKTEESDFKRELNDVLDRYRI